MIRVIIECDTPEEARAVQQRVQQAPAPQPTPQPTGAGVGPEQT